MRCRIPTILFVIAASCCVSLGSVAATTLDAVSIDPHPFFEQSATISTDNGIGASVGPSILLQVAASAPLSNGAVDSSRVTPQDLVVFDGRVLPELLVLGTALDIAVDTSANTISILYGLSSNFVSSDDFAVTVLTFPFDLFPDELDDVGDLEQVQVNFAAFFATEDPLMAPVPLPFSALFLCTGITMIIGCRSYKKAMQSA